MQKCSTVSHIHSENFPNASQISKDQKGAEKLESGLFRVDFGWSIGNSVILGEIMLADSVKRESLGVKDGESG